MGKTSDIKDRLLAVSGFIRARHVATLLKCDPRTVIRNRYEGITYGSVWYVKWENVLSQLAPEAVAMLKLPSSAFVALDVARGFAKPTETAKECGDWLEKKFPSFVERADAALQKAKQVLEPPVSLSVPVAVKEETVKATVEALIEAPILALPIKKEEILTIAGSILVPVIPIVKAATVDDCKYCGHALDPFHQTKFGACKFAKDTEAQCLCKRAA